MRTVGVRELRERIGQILKEVSEGESVQVTHHGKVMAHLVPPRQSISPEETSRAMARAHALMEQIGDRVAGPTDAWELLQGGRQ